MVELRKKSNKLTNDKFDAMVLPGEVSEMVSDYNDKAHS